MTPDLDQLFVDEFPGLPPEDGDALLRLAMEGYDTEMAMAQANIAMRGFRSDRGWSLGVSVAAFIPEGRTDHYQIRLAAGPVFGSILEDPIAQARLEAKLMSL